MIARCERIVATEHESGSSCRHLQITFLDEAACQRCYRVSANCRAAVRSVSRLLAISSGDGLDEFADNEENFDSSIRSPLPCRIIAATMTTAISLCRHVIVTLRTT